MKKTIIFCSILIMLFSLCYGASAVHNPTTANIEYLEDGSYFVTTIVEEIDSIATYSTATKSGRKSSTYYNSESEALWSITLTGTFSYDGTTATCTDANLTYTIYNSNWRMISTTATASGNTAMGTAYAKQYVLGVPINSAERSIEICCSPTGVLS